jgi:hypothetical protein
MLHLYRLLLLPKLLLLLLVSVTMQQVSQWRGV